MAASKPPSLAKRLIEAGVHKSHAYQVVKRASPRVALRIFQRTGIKVGPLEKATDAEIRLLQRIEDRSQAADDASSQAA
jgi:hypothetical protein